MGRPSGRHGLRGNGPAPADSQPLSPRGIPADVRSPGRVLQHRRECLHRHHLLGAEVSRRRRPVFRNGSRSCLPAAGHGPGGGRLRHLRTHHPAGADRGRRGGVLHPGPGDRLLCAHPGKHPDSRGHQGIRHQHVQPAPLGAAGPALRGRAAAGQGRPPGQGFQHALGGFHGGRRPPHPAAGRHLSLPRRHSEGVRPGPAPAAL